jgi:phosphoribosylglycinamide formyltransferase-1
VTNVLLRAFPDRVINVHPSLLPAFRGLHAQRQAIDHGVKITGCTVHFVGEEVDSGAIILQATVPILGDDTETTLSERILEEEHRLLPQALQLYAEGRLTIQGRRVLITPNAHVLH